MSPAHTAAAVCAAGRWFPAAALAVVAAVLVVAGMRPLEGGWFGSLLLAILVTAAVQVYFAARLEFDRHIFEGIAREADAEVAFAAFDRQVRELRLGQPRTGRTAQQRAAGAARMVRWSAGLFFAQLALAIAAVWSLA